jgi:hypothetical protein
VPEDSRPPVAIRITRPYTTEDEFLEQELETLSRTSVTLLGAQPRPQGVVLRFELVLSSGHVLMRGEGRVVAFKPNAHQGLGGLSLRFTRLDSRSKSLVDKATALRERRRPSGAPAPPPEPSPPPPPVSVASVPSLDAVFSPPPPRVGVTTLPGVPAPPPPPISFAGAVPPVPPSDPAFPPLDLESTRAEAPASKRSERPPRPSLPPLAPAPGGRDALLERLRKRADSLGAAAMQRILEEKKGHASEG